MNLLEIITACENRSGFNDTTFRGVWRDFINEGVREYSRRYPWPGLEDFVQLVSDGSRYLVLPHYVDQVVSLLNKTTNVSVDRSGDFDRRWGPAQAQRTAGPTTEYDKIGIVPVLRDPTGFLQLYSTSTSDTGSPFAAYITGYASNSGASGTGLEKTLRTLSINPTGISPLTLSILFATIVSISKATDSNGDFFFNDAGDSNRQISFLARSERSAAFKRLQLIYLPTPQSSFELRFRHKVPALTVDEQAPHPAVDTDFVIQYALGNFYRHHQQFTKAQIQDQRALSVLERAANKQENFDESFTQINPQVWIDPDRESL